MSCESWYLQLVQWTPTMTLKLIIITCFAQQDISKHGARRGLIKHLHIEPYPFGKLLLVRKPSLISFRMQYHIEGDSICKETIPDILSFQLSPLSL